MKSSTVAVSLVLGAVCFVPASAFQSLSIVVPDAGGSNTTYGYGFDTVTMNVIPNQCVTYGGTPNEEVPDQGAGPSAGLTQIYFTDESDLAAFHSHESMSASVAMKLGLFSGSGSVSTVANKDVSSFSRSITYRAYWKQARHLRSYALSPIAKDALKDGSFQRVCGDAYVFGIQRGGALEVMITSNSTNSEDRSSVAGAFSIAMGLQKLEGEAEKKLVELQSSNKIKVEVIRKGPLENVPTDLAKLNAYSRDFVRRSQSRPDQIAFTVQSYPEVQTQDTSAPAIAERFRALRQTRADRQYAAAHVDEIGGFDSDLNNSAISKIDEELNKLTIDLQNCLRGKAACPIVSSEPIDSLPSPIDWKVLDPKNGFVELAPRRNESGWVVELRGEYSGGKTSPWLPVAQHSVIEIRTPNETLLLNGDAVYQVPPGSSVSAEICTGDRANTRMSNTSRPRAAVYKPMTTMRDVVPVEKLKAHVVTAPCIF